jgi:DNA-binding ferritin-like protein
MLLPRHPQIREKPGFHYFLLLHQFAFVTMASTIAESVRKVGDSVADSVTTMSENKKIADLQRNMKDQNTKQNTTTDYGAQVPDLDHWLKTVDDKNQKIGPHLLEDHTGRERVCRTKLPMFFSNVR